MYSTPQPSGISRFSATMFSNLSALNLVNPHFLQMWIFWRPGNWSLALPGGLNHMLLVLQPGADGHHDVANVDPDHCALGLSKGTAHTCLEPRLGTACQSLMSTGKGCLQGPLGQPIQATGCMHYRGGCCLQPVRTGPPWGKEHSRLDWLQMIDTF